MSDDGTPTFDDPVAEARHWRLLAKDRQDELEDLKVAFSDILATSKELEDEMERDLAAMEKREHELRSENERLKGEVDALKARHQTALKEQSITLQHMQKELEDLRGSEKRLRTKLRDMELDNDDLEKSERAISSTLGDVENRYNKAIERTALLEQELVDKAKLEEEVQRVKDELRDTLEELGVLRSQRDDALRNLEAFKVNGGGPQTPDRRSRQATKEVAPSPDIDSDDHHSARDGSLNGSNGESQAGTALPSGDPAASLTSPEAISPDKRQPSLNALSSLQPPLATNMPLARSSNTRNLSYLARKSLTPKDVRDKRGDAVISDMKDMASRMQSLRVQLNNRRESLMTTSSIPRPRHSMLSTSTLPRSSSSTSSVASGSLIARSASVRGGGLIVSPSKRDLSATSSRSASRPLSRASNGGTTRGSTVPANGEPSRPRTTRPLSRLSSLGASRPMTPASLSARTPTPSSAAADLGHSHPSRPSSRQSTTIPPRTPRRVSMGPGRRVLNLSDQPDVPDGSAAKSSASKPLPAWR